MWFSGTAAKRLNGLHWDVAAFLRGQRERELAALQLKRDREERRTANVNSARAAETRVKKDKKMKRANQRADTWSVQPPTDATAPVALVPQAIVDQFLERVRAADCHGARAILAPLPAAACFALVNCVSQVRQWRPLHLCARHRDSTMAALLVSAGAEINASDSVHNTALHLACLHENFALITYLILTVGAESELSNDAERVPAEMLGPKNGDRLMDARRHKLVTFVGLVRQQRRERDQLINRRERHAEMQNVRRVWNQRHVECNREKYRERAKHSQLVGDSAHGSSFEEKSMEALPQTSALSPYQSLQLFLANNVTRCSHRYTQVPSQLHMRPSTAPATIQLRDEAVDQLHREHRLSRPATVFNVPRMSAARVRVQNDTQSSSQLQRPLTPVHPAWHRTRSSLAPSITHVHSAAIELDVRHHDMDSDSEEDEDQYDMPARASAQPTAGARTLALSTRPLLRSLLQRECILPAAD